MGIPRFGIIYYISASVVEGVKAGRDKRALPAGRRRYGLDSHVRRLFGPAG